MRGKLISPVQMRTVSVGPSRWRGRSSNHLPVDVWDLEVVNTMLEDILFLTSGSWSSIVIITCLFSTGHSRTASFSPLHR